MACVYKHEAIKNTAASTAAKNEACIGWLHESCNLIWVCTRFDVSFWSVAVKLYSFATLCWVNKDENIYPNKFSQPIRQYIPHNLLKTNSFSETTVSQVQPALILWIQQY